MTSPPPFARVLALSNRKGGVGKTTSAVNIAAEFGRRGLRTLLLDMDTQGHAACGFGLSPVRGSPRAHDALRGDGIDLAGAIRSTGQPNVCIIPADADYEAADSPTPATRLRQALAPLLDQFDRVVIDTPPSLGGVLVNALTAADAVLIPLVPHHLAAEGIGQLTRLIFRVVTGWLVKPVASDQLLAVIRQVAPNAL